MLRQTGYGGGVSGAAQASASKLGARLAAVCLAERERWFLWSPVLLGLGIAVFFELRFQPPAWLGGLSVVASLLLAVAARRRPAVLLVGLALSVVAGGFALADFRARWVAAPVLEKRLGPVAVEGRVLAVSGIATGWRLLLESPRIGRLAPEKTPQTVRVSVRTPLPDGLAVGDRVRLPAVLMPPPAPAAPGAFDFARMAWFQGLGAVGYAVGRPRLEPAPPDAEAPGFSARLAELRRRIAHRVRWALPGPSGAVAAALLTGDRGAIPQSVLAAMRGGGRAWCGRRRMPGRPGSRPG